MTTPGNGVHPRVLSTAYCTAHRTIPSKRPPWRTLTPCVHERYPFDHQGLFNPQWTERLEKGSRSRRK